SFSCSGDLPDLHSFPTRRSSDLLVELDDAFGLVADVDDDVVADDVEDLALDDLVGLEDLFLVGDVVEDVALEVFFELVLEIDVEDRKSTRLNSSHVAISYAVFCL